MNESMTLGFVGLGIMGRRMAANLLDDGADLVVYNRTKAKADPLVEQGATWADTPADLARRVDLLFTMVANPEAVRQVALGPDGFLDALKPGTLWADCSTVNPSFTRTMADEARERDIRFVDAPVAGTKGPAEEGALLFLVGGEEADVDVCRPYFEVMGREVVHIGGQGMGTALKMVVNMLLGTSMVAFSEALALGQSLGIDRKQLVDTLIGSPVVAPFLEYKRSKIEEGEYEPDFPLKWMLKDMHLAALTGYEEGTALPTENAAKEVFALAARQGWSEQDFAAVYELLNDQAD